MVMMGVSYWGILGPNLSAAVRDCLKALCVNVVTGRIR